MKGYALVQRDKKKDAYDIYLCVRNQEDGIDALAADCAKLLDDPVARQRLLEYRGQVRQRRRFRTANGARVCRRIRLRSAT